ncbi:hypothetical protein KG522_004607 [Salmonella enterica subsp. diarizonae serovar 50:z52:z35]|nr:hypothetical protein [Salmonella enterica subsp. diarizonae serovar 50:z52:z35]HAK7957765.1 hypothetical protein [Salmonella enterica]HAK8071782.1 hypothetical protein [Salmonella enterica]HAK8370380.1 hypothetical protein [Salmonella enterica]HAK8522584.1 hypothetical protein [Salmonella enterica]
MSGYLVDGEAFDDSGEKGRVQRVKPSDLLPALTGVLTALRAGSHVEVLLPPAQAFGGEGNDTGGRNAAVWHPCAESFSRR